MKISPRDAAVFIAKPPASIRAILLYGENSGLAREYAETLTSQIVKNPGDSERIVQLSAADLRKDPARLSDEAAQMSMFSPGRRVIRVRDASEGLGELFQSYWTESSADALVIVEAGELGPKASLRVVFEQTPVAAAIACYEDRFETLTQLAADELASLSIQHEDGTLDLLVARTGLDRRIVRSEIEKIGVYFGDGSMPKRKLTRKLVDEFLGQSGEVESSEIAAAVALGDHRLLERLLTQAEDIGGNPSSLVSTTLRHLYALYSAKAQGPGGDGVKAARSRGLWGQSDVAIQSQLRVWTIEGLAAALRVLGQAEADTRNAVWPAWPVAGRALLHAARIAR